MHFIEQNTLYLHLKYKKFSKKNPIQLLEANIFKANFLRIKIFLLKIYHI